MLFSAQTCAKERQIQLEEYSNLAIDGGSRKKKKEEREGGREGANIISACEIE